MKVAVLLSGGVDSSVTALLLKEQGFDVVGLTMVNWDNDVAGKAREAARWLDIEHRVVDLRKIFETKIIDYFCTAYQSGKTPNPCVECNKYIKFGVLLDMARDMGYDMVATGHYARIEYNSQSKRYLLKKGVDNRKDQSYFLYGLKQEQLSHILFPLGNMVKSEVRELARQKGMSVAEAAESQEICFISGDYRDFIKDKITCSDGSIIDRESKQVLGTHHGLPFYTIGQRKGLGISSSHPLYVSGMDVITNQLLVGPEQELFKTTLFADNNNFIYIDKITGAIQVKAKIRYRAEASEAVISRDNDKVRVEFSKPQRAITPGQSVVYYQGDYVVGGGTIIAS